MRKSELRGDRHGLSEEEQEKFNAIATELEDEWRRSRPSYTERELVEVFSPPPEMILEKLEDREKERKVRTRAIKNSLKEVYSFETDDLSKWFGEKMIKTFLFPKLEKCNQHISRLGRILNILTPQNSMESNNGELVEKARRYPIYDIAKQRLLLRECGNKYSASCPFHQEKTPSFYIYPETNTFHCFGCQEHGDVIQLTRHLYGVSFWEAVKMLQ